MGRGVASRARRQHDRACRAGRRSKNVAQTYVGVGAGLRMPKAVPENTFTQYGLFEGDQYVIDFTKGDDGITYINYISKVLHNGLCIADGITEPELADRIFKTVRDGGGKITSYNGKPTERSAPPVLGLVDDSGALTKID